MNNQIKNTDERAKLMQHFIEKYDLANVRDFKIFLGALLLEMGYEIPKITKEMEVFPRYIAGEDGWCIDNWYILAKHNTKVILRWEE
jgi:hypothetical protein